MDWLLKAEWFRTQGLAWKRLSFVVGLALVCWTGLLMFIPADIYKPVSVILATIQAAVTFIMHSGEQSRS